jgi:hypothetical protein
LGRAPESTRKLHKGGSTRLQEASCKLQKALGELQKAPRKFGKSSRKGSRELQESSRRLQEASCKLQKTLGELQKAAKNSGRALDGSRQLQESSTRHQEAFRKPQKPLEQGIAASLSHCRVVPGGHRGSWRAEALPDTQSRRLYVLVFCSQLRPSGKTLLWAHCGCDSKCRRHYISSSRSNVKESGGRAVASCRPTRSSAAACSRHSSSLTTCAVRGRS